MQKPKRVYIYFSLKVAAWTRVVEDGVNVA